MVPKECKYCGCEEVAETFAEFVYFRCGTTYWPESGMWTGAGKCVGRCAERLRELRERVQRAVEVMEGATRFDVIPWDGGVCRDPSNGGGEVDADIVDQVLEILRGNAPEIPDSSPITTDHLAVAKERIRRAIDTLKTATRYRVIPVSRTHVEWDTADDGPLTDSNAVDEALGILEGERE